MPDSAPPPDANADALYREMRARVREIFDHALSECSIPRALGKKLEHNERYLQVDEMVYDLGAFTRVLAISIGKAGYSLAENFAGLIDAELTGIIAAPGAAPAELPGFQYFSGGHPLPNEDSLRAGEAILQLVAGLSPETLVVFLISGGASAIAEKPIRSRISLADVVQTYRALVHSGAPIAEINAIRKHLSALKGGRLARAASPAYQLSMLVSDVPEGALDALASGPTVPDSTTVKDCYNIAERYQLLDRLPQSVRALFESGQLEETPKAGDPAFEKSQYVTVLSNATAVSAAVEQAALAGFAVDVENACDDWDYEQAADFLSGTAAGTAQGSVARLPDLGWRGDGEDRRGARSGRTQSAVCAVLCAEDCGREHHRAERRNRRHRRQQRCRGSDCRRVDGGTSAASRDSMRRTALAKFDSYPLFQAIGDAIMTGPTGNNVRDLRILLAY